MMSLYGCLCYLVMGSLFGVGQSTETSHELLDRMDELEWQVENACASPGYGYFKENREQEEERVRIAIRTARRLEYLGLSENSPLIQSQGQARRLYIEALVGRRSPTWKTELTELRSLVGRYATSARSLEIKIYVGHMLSVFSDDTRDRQVGIVWLTEAIEDAAKLRNQVLLVRAYNTCAEAYYEYEDLEKARSLAIKGLVVAENSGDARIQRTALVPVVCIRSAEGGPSLARPYAEKLISIESDSEIAIGVLSQLGGPFAVARAKIFEAVQSSPHRIAESEDLRANIDFQHAAVLRSLGQYQDAIEKLERATVGFQRLGDLPQSISCRIEITDLRNRLRLPLQDTVGLSEFREQAFPPRRASLLAEKMGKAHEAASQSEDAAAWFRESASSMKLATQSNFESVLASARDSFTVEEHHRQAIAQHQQQIARQDRVHIRNTCMVIVFAFSVTTLLMCWRLVQSRRMLAALRLEVEARAAAEKETRAVQHQLQRSQRLESVGTLAAGLAHDINNSLTVINSFVQLWELECRPDSGGADYVKHISNGVTQASNITKGLLTFGGQQETTKELVDLFELLIEEEPFLRLVLNNSTDFSVDGASGGVCRIDRVQIKQVLTNLLLNSRDALLSGGEVRIRVLPFVTSASHLIVVSDNGEGMDDETKSKVFDPFFTTKQHGKGTGLGLSLVYGIIQDHDGTIELESEIGIGTSFSILLPHAATKRQERPKNRESAQSLKKPKELPSSQNEKAA